MKVICAGMSKTGTKSLHVALEMLGYDVHGFSEAFQHFEDEYNNFVDRGWKTSKFRKMYEGIDAVEDGPAWYFWEELAEAFPDAKVVLTLRDDDDSWYKSFQGMASSLQGRHWYYYPLISPTWRRFMRFILNTAVSFGNKYVTGFETRYPGCPNIPYKQSYRRHNAHVLNKCPKKRLLVFSCRSGWEPLCEFLDKPVPESPFPKVNVAGDLKEKLWDEFYMKEAKKEVRIGFVVTTIALFGIVGYLTWKCNL